MTRPAIPALAIMAMWCQSLPLRAEVADADKMNAAWGIPLFLAEGSTWDEDADAVAQRLGLPEESRTSAESSFRLYPSEVTRVLGRRPYSIALTAAQGRVTGLSIIFANKGDSLGPSATATPGPREAGPTTRDLRDYRKAIADDERALDELLGTVAGEAAPERTGQGSKLTERAKRRDWRDHALLLVSVRDEYVAVRVVPPSDLDEAALVKKVPPAELREKLQARVERSPNGDVILRDLPMVDQGPKGFCVPATMERMLRYLGIPADMYLLAMAANTRPGGGTTINDLLWAVGDTVRRHGRRIQTESGNPDVNHVSRWIEAGLPILWAINTSDAVDQRINEHTRQRAGVTDWKAWNDGLKPARREAKKLSREASEGHVCLIVGFNRETGEIALSDSWGPGYAERWTTVEEAAAISQGSMAVVTW
ncbi:MAG: hypothetical protein ACOYOL_03525 [Chthoniobacterales bacterium]